jgi:putative membrane protein
MKVRRIKLMSNQRGVDRGMPWVYRAIVIGGSVAVLAAVIIAALVLRPPWFSGDSSYPGFRFFWFFPFFGFLVVIFLVKWSFWGWGWRSTDWRYYSGAKQILEERYARGDLTKDQFEQMKRDLDR